MVMGSRPQRGRPVTGVPEAARILGRDVRTVRRMIESGELEGGAAPGRQRRHWFVYTDQLVPFAPASGGAGNRAERAELAGMRAELARMRAENADLRARAVAAEEGERLLLAGHAPLRETLRESQSTIAALLAAHESTNRGADGYRAAADGYRAAAEDFRDGAAGYLQVVAQAHATNGMLQNVLEQYSDTIAQHITPGHPGELNP
jgi:hypothetical protein